jgi:hypothetical protein
MNAEQMMHLRARMPAAVICGFSTSKPVASVSPATCVPLGDFYCEPKKELPI